MKNNSANACTRIDRAFQKATKWLLYVGAAVLIFVMMVAFVDVIIAKVFGSSIPYATEIIQYCDVPLAYLGMGYTLLIGQMTSVDLLFGKFSMKMQKILNMFYDVIGVGFCVFLGKLSLDNMLNLMANNTMSNPKGGFPVWPFAMVETLSWFVLAVAFVFCFLRYMLRYTPEPDFMSAPSAIAGGDTCEEGGTEK